MVKSRSWYFNSIHELLIDQQVKKEELLEREDFASIILGEGKVRQLYVLKGVITFLEPVEKDWVLKTLMISDTYHLPDNGSMDFRNNIDSTMDKVYEIRNTPSPLPLEREKREKPKGLPGLTCVYDEDECLNCGS